MARTPDCRFFKLKNNAFLFLLMLQLLLHTQGLSQDFSIYTDSLQNGWQNYGWATLNYQNSSPAHSGTASISVTAKAYEALYLHHDAFDSTPYLSLSFWIHGGSTGGQRLQVQGTLTGSAKTAYSLTTLPANTWQQITIPLSSLAVSNKPNLDGFWIQDRSGVSQAAFYVDDIRLVAAPIATNASLSINPTSIVQTVDRRMFAVNTAIWDSLFDSTTTINLLKEADFQVLRFPGGSLSDEYHWASNTTSSNTWTWATSFARFVHVATNVGAQAFITVNYGTGTPAEAAAWVRHANLTNKLGFKHWEIGNENYGTWEKDSNPLPNEPFTYATRAADYISQMKAADPSIKIGVVAVTGEDSYSNGYSAHTVTNPRTGIKHNGWTPVMLSTLRSLGVTPDFLIYHRYEQGPGSENDAVLLQSAKTWKNDAADLRQQLTDYMGSSHTNVEIVCTENNSVYSNPGKQSTSLVNALFYADSMGQILQTEFKSFVWWDWRNGTETNNTSASLYGWRINGDYGMISSKNERYPTFHAAKLMKSFAREADSIVTATSDHSMLACYASLHKNGELALMLINKNPTTTIRTRISATSFQAAPSATMFQYGISQDESARTGIGSPDISTSTLTLDLTNPGLDLPPYSLSVLVLSPATANLNQSLSLRWVMNSNSTPSLALDGMAGRSAIIQSSVDLVTWKSISTNNLLVANLQLDVLQGTNGFPALQPVFFRAVLTP